MEEAVHLPLYDKVIQALNTSELVTYNDTFPIKGFYRKKGVFQEAVACTFNEDFIGTKTNGDLFLKKIATNNTLSKLVHILKDALKGDDVNFTWRPGNYSYDILYSPTIGIHFHIGRFMKSRAYGESANHIALYPIEKYVSGEQLVEITKIGFAYRKEKIDYSSKTEPVIFDSLNADFPVKGDVYATIYVHFPLDNNEFDNYISREKVREDAKACSRRFFKLYRFEGDNHDPSYFNLSKKRYI